MPGRGSLRDCECVGLFEHVHSERIPASLSLALVNGIVGCPYPEWGAVHTWCEVQQSGQRTIHLRAALWVDGWGRGRGIGAFARALAPSPAVPKRYGACPDSVHRRRRRWRAADPDRNFLVVNSGKLRLEVVSTACLIVWSTKTKWELPA